jgi:hypothetical protein
MMEAFLTVPIVVVFTKSDQIMQTLVLRATEDNEDLTESQAHKMVTEGKLDDEEVARTCLDTLKRAPYAGKWSGAAVVSAEKGRSSVKCDYQMIDN